MKWNVTVSIRCVLIAHFLPFPNPFSFSFSCIVASGASGSFSTNSPASPLSSISLTSPLSPFSPLPGSQASPNKQLGPEVSTGHTQPVTNPNPKLNTNPFLGSKANPEVHRRLSPKLRYRPKSYREPDTTLSVEHVNEYGCETYEHAFPQTSLALQNLRQTLSRLDPVLEETDQNQNINCRTNSTLNHPIHLNAAKVRAEEKVCGLHGHCQNSKYSNQHSDKVQTHSPHQKNCWLTSEDCKQEVRVGLRKDVYPDSHPSHFAVGYSNISSKRRFSMPESQILLLQDSYESSFPCFRSGDPKTQKQHQLHSQFHDRACTRPLTYPNNQGKLDFDPMICVITSSDSQSKYSGTVFMQTHL